MKFMMLLTFAVAACKGGIWIALGLLIRNHLEAFLALILRKPIPENLISQEEKDRTRKIYDFIGLLLVGIGVCVILIGLLTWIMSFRIPSGNFNFNF